MYRLPKEFHSCCAKLSELCGHGQYVSVSMKALQALFTPASSIEISVQASKSKSHKLATPSARFGPELVTYSKVLVGMVAVTSFSIGIRRRSFLQGCSPN